jgi:hypothetical protein
MTTLNYNLRGRRTPSDNDLFRMEMTTAKKLPWLHDVLAEIQFLRDSEVNSDEEIEQEIETSATADHARIKYLESVLDGVGAEYDK